MDCSDYYPLTNETALLRHAEDFSNLLKKAMELAEVFRDYPKWTRYFSFSKDLILINQVTINPWTYLIDLTKDSFDCAMKKDRNLAELLLKKWQLYPYSLFYRLILYAVTKHSDLNEKIALELLGNKKNCFMVKHLSK